MPFKQILNCLATIGLVSQLSSAFPIVAYNNGLQVRELNQTSAAALHSCLESTGDFHRYYSDTSGYANHSSSYNPLFNYKPYVIAVPSTTDDVASIIRCVSDQGGSQKLSPKSGGHSYEAYSLGGQDGTVVVDLRRIKDVNVDTAAKTATVGAGVRLGNLAETIFDQGGFALPHGTCPLVGVGGHSLGGGFGYTTRAWGFLMDRITTMKMVDHTGTLLTVSPTENTDLWWALRGGGANNFGIVTEFTYSLLDGPSSILNYAYSYRSHEDCAHMLVALQSMTLATDADQGLPKEFGGELLFAGSNSGDFDGNACQLSGQHISTSRSDHDSLVGKLHSSAGVSPSVTTVTPFTSWKDSLTNIMGTLTTTVSQASSDHEQFYAKSLVQPYSALYNYDSALALIQKLNGYVGLQGTGNSISFDFLGPLSYPGHSVSTASAFNAHNATFVNQFYSYGFPSDNGKGQQDQVWNAFDDLVSTAMAAAPKEPWGAYVNYVDARLDNWPTAYYGDALSRLKSLKAQYDPKTIFDFPQSLARA